MDFVKREEYGVLDEESYKAYSDALHKQHQQNNPEYQPTISMEQLHHTVQSSLNTGSLPQNFQLQLSPRQMSTLMLKSNLTRNLNYDIPSHLSRNLTAEIDLAHDLTYDYGVAPIEQIRHQNDVLTRNLNDASLIRNLANDMELQQLGLAQTLVQSLNEQMDLSRSLQTEMGQNLSSRNMDLHVQNRVIGQDYSHELDLSHHAKHHPEESLKTSINSVPVSTNMLGQNIGESLGSPMLVVQPLRPTEQTDHHIPMPFHIKAEQEDDGYFYDQLNHGFSSNMNEIPAHIPLTAEQSQINSAQQDNQLFTAYNTHVANLNTLNSVEPHTRAFYFQNFPTDNQARENPQNLVVHRELNNSPYSTQDGGLQNGGVKIEKAGLPKENLKPTENKMFMYSNMYSEKNENDSSEDNKLGTEENKFNLKEEYVCYSCNNTFSSKRGLKQHAKTCQKIGEESAEKNGKFSCNQCSYKCQSPAILKNHQRTHTGEKPFQCTFPDCNYKSAQKNNVAKHILIHMNEKPFRCKYCDYGSAQKNNLVIHERTHTGEKPFKCPYCDYETAQKPNLVKHVYVHTDQKPFSCDMCSYRSVQKTNLTKHKKRHLNEKEGDKLDVKNVNKPYRPRKKSLKCPQCFYSCVQKSSLDKHMKFNHGEDGSGNVEFEQGLNLMKDDNSVCEGTAQDLCVKKDPEVYASELCQEKSDDHLMETQSS